MQPKDTIKRFQPFVPNLLWCQVKLHCERPNCYNKNTISLVQLTLKTYGWATAVIKFKIESACLILVETDAMFFVVSKRSPCCEIKYFLGILTNIFCFSRYDVLDAMNMNFKLIFVVKNFWFCLCLNAPFQLVSIFKIKGRYASTFAHNSVFFWDSNHFVG